MNKRIDHTGTTGISNNLAGIRNEFPIINEKIYGKPLIYFDNAATTQKPVSVIDTIDNYYRHKNSNIHRGVHYLSNAATELYENSRESIKKYINAKKNSEIIYTRGTTEGINLVAQSFVKKIIGKGDEILISAMEHHSNIVPWQILCKEKECKLKIIPMDRKGNLIIEKIPALINENTKFLSITQVSNALGTVNNIKMVIKIAHDNNIPILIDGAQAIPHKKIDVRELECDFFVFSGHKVYGPTGIGILYGKEKLLEEMDPYQGGGDMIRSVTFEKTVYNDLPYKFEAGTPNIAGAIGLGEAINFMNRTGIENIEKYEKKLLQFATSEISKIDGIRIIGMAEEKSGVLSFIIEGVHPHDIGTILDQDGIAIRTGHHCSQPVMNFFNIPATARASFACYNTLEEIEIFTDALKKIKEVFR